MGKHEPATLKLPVNVQKLAVIFCSLSFVNSKLVVLTYLDCMQAGETTVLLGMED